MNIVTLLLFIAGFVLLVAGAELLVRGASGLAVAIGIAPLVVGLTVVAYGTSAPEAAVTLRAMYAHPPRPDLAIGNVVGSNISNILLVLGIAALVRPLQVHRQLVRSTVPFLLVVTGLMWAMSLDGVIARTEGMLLLAGAVGYSAWSVIRSRRSVALQRSVEADHDEHHQRGFLQIALLLGMVVAGLIALVLGAHWLVEGATTVARYLHVSELVIGLTVVAVGTSLPEIATSSVASVRGHGDIAVGNVVGSHIFNLLLVLGLTASLAPAPVLVNTAALRCDIPVMVAVTIACWPILFTNWRITRWEGALFLSYYCAYIVLLVLQATHHAALQQYQSVMIYGIVPLTVLLLVVLAIRFRYQEARARQHQESS